MSAMRSCAYWDRFQEQKLYYQLIQYHPCYALDAHGLYGNNMTAFILSDDLYLLALLNSPLLWWYNWRYLPHMKDEALAPNPTVLENVPVARPSDKTRSQVEKFTRRVLEITASQLSMQAVMLDWLQVE